MFSGGVQTPGTPAQSLWQTLTHGFDLSGVVQGYSAAPFTITSGVTTVQGTTGRPIVDGEYIPRNAGVGDGFFTMSLRLARAFPLGRSVKLEAIAELFNATNTVNETARNTTFGSGAYPSSPAPTFNQVTAVGEPRGAQLAVRLRF